MTKLDHARGVLALGIVLASALGARDALAQDPAAKPATEAQADGTGETAPAPPAATAAAPSDVPAKDELPPHPYLRTQILSWTGVGLLALHHTEDGLRGESSFPLKKKPGEFTALFLIYPFFIGGELLDMGPNYWLVFDSAALLAFSIGHAINEPPSEIYEKWTDRSNELDVSSPFLGRAGQVMFVVNGILLASHLVSSIADGVNYGFTWKRRKPEAKASARRGMQVSTTGSGLHLTW